MNININGRSVGHGHKCYFIAEIGINHNGDLSTALKLIDAAVDAGAEAVKFQKRTVPIVYKPDELATQREVHPSIISNAMGRCSIEGVNYQVFPPENLERL
jgi:sialic acid synthase SpsE